ncbi:hypothetical protein ACO1O0_006657 [Amphichorda felina]
MATTLLNPHEPADAVPPPAQPPRQIRFVNNQGHPPSKRRRINAACLTCRRRKTRCAGERPQCSTCTKNGHRCLGYPEDKKDSNDAGDAKLDIDEDDRQEYDPNTTTSNDKQGIDEDRPAKRPRVAATATSTLSNPNTALESQPIPSSRKPSKPIPPVAQHNAKPIATSLPKVEASSPPAPAARATASPQVGYAHTTGSHTSHPEEIGSPSMLRRHVQNSSHRVPYFRYFGPTAIVPGFKQMVVSVKDRRRSTNGSHSCPSPLSNPSGVVGSTAAESDVVIEDAPVYDPNDPAPVHPLIISLAKTFFVHLGCNYPFLKQRKFIAMTKEKRAEPILVDAVCALAARFSDSPILTGGNDKMPRTERGHVFAQRAKQATVDTFACPTVAAVQACLLMAYEGFGANQDSALWMYLGLAIRMAVDLGLQKCIGIQYQGENDPWNTQQRSRTTAESASPEDTKPLPDTPSHAEQKELEQERLDTFWAVFFLDRVISSGTGRPVTLRDEDFELAFPKPALHPDAQWPSPFPVLIEIVHLSGRVSDVLNNIHDISDLTQEKWQKLMAMENQLTKVYKNWDSRMQFNVVNFKAYLSIGQGTNFILLHFWFHALFIILHQPTLLSPFGELRTELQLLPDSRELSMSSAKTICDILAFADLIDPKSFIGNPFTSQPMYIAACAFLMEQSATASQAPSRESSPPATKPGASGRSAKESSGKKSRHSLLASAANQNYQRCYSSLENLHTYWGGVKYILTALDQKAKGIWDCETFTTEEYESTKLRQDSIGSQFQFDNQTTSPKMTGPPIGWTLAGTANSPSSSLTLMYQNPNAPVGHIGAPLASSSMPRSGSTPPGTLMEEPARHGVREPGGMYPPPFPQPVTSAVRASPRHQVSTLQQSGVRTQSMMKVDGIPEETEGGMFIPANTTNFTPTSQHSGGGFDGYSASPSSTMADGNRGMNGANSNVYYPHNMPYQAPWGPGTGNMDAITFDSQDIDIGALGLQQPELMGQWLDYIPGDVLGLFDQHEMNQGGQGGP